MNSPALYIARHISTKGGRHGRRPPSVLIAVSTIALAVVVLELTLAVVSGFKQGIVEKVRGFDTDITILPAYDYDTGRTAPFITMSPILDDIVKESLPEAGACLEFRYPAVLKTANDFSAIVIRGYGQGHDYSFESANIIDGEWPDFSTAENDNKIVVSSATADALGLSTGEKIDTYFFVDGGIKARKPEIAGIYNSNFGENDRLIAYSSIHWLQRITRTDSLTGTSIGLRFSGFPDPDSIATKAGDLQQNLISAARTGVLPDIYPVDNIAHTNGVYFSWLDLLDTNVTVIFILMAAVAGFTLISTLVILILERVRTIGLLRALGMRTAAIRRVFIFVLLKCVILGMAIGNLLGLGIIFVQSKWSLLKLDPEMYYLAAVPVKPDVLQILSLNVGLFLLAWVVLMLPAHLVSGVSPAQTMRYE